MKAYKLRMNKKLYTNVKLNLNDDDKQYSEKKQDLKLRSSDFSLGLSNKDLSVENSIQSPTNMKSFEEYMEMNNPSLNNMNTEEYQKCNSARKDLKMKFDKKYKKMLRNKAKEETRQSIPNIYPSPNRENHLKYNTNSRPIPAHFSPVLAQNKLRPVRIKQYNNHIDDYFFSEIKIQGIS